MRKLLILLVCMAALAVGACAKKESTVVKAPKDVQSLFQEGEALLAEGKYIEAIAKFETIETGYPFSPQAKSALLQSIYAYYKRDDLASVNSTAKQFLRLYPRDEHADYAMYMKGVANFETGHGMLTDYLPLDLAKRDLSHEREAFEDFSQLLANYPQSSYAQDAHKRMIFLRNMLARQEAVVAEYYYRRGSYVAAVNRATFLLEHFDGSPEVVDALMILVKSYRKMNMNELAQQALEVMHTNFPNSKQYRNLLGHAKG